MEKQHEMEIVKEAFTLLNKENLTDEMVDEAFGLFGKVFDKDCLKQIRKGFKNQLSMEQVGAYAKPEFTWKQMEEIRVGFEVGLSMEEVSVYANHDFTDAQMRQVRWGFQTGLSMEQVLVYAKPEFTRKQMEEMRVGVEDIPPHSRDFSHE